MDITEANWGTTYQDFVYGIRKFYLKEDIPSAELNYNQLLVKMNAASNYDQIVALDISKTMEESDNVTFFNSILDKGRYENFFI